MFVLEGKRQTFPHYSVVKGSPTKTIRYISNGWKPLEIIPEEISTLSLADGLTNVNFGSFSSLGQMKKMRFSSVLIRLVLCRDPSSTEPPLTFA